VLACPPMPSVPVRVFLLATFLLASSCGELKLPTEPPGGGNPPDPTATFTRVQNEIFTPSCSLIGCHDRIGQQSQLILSPGSAYTNIVNVPSVELPQIHRVTPNDPANSYLYRKVVGSGITGDRMPQTSPALTDAEIALIRDWIRRGAPND
jgi:hypothetical protein